MAHRHLYVEVRSPDGEVFTGDATAVLLPGRKGSFGVLPRHAPLVSSLDFGFTRVRTTSAEHEFVTGEGFCEIQGDKVLVLVDSAEYVGRIDIERAEASAERAKERLRSPDRDVDRMRAEASLARATTRLRHARSVVGR